MTKKQTLFNNYKTNKSNPDLLNKAKLISANIANVRFEKKETSLRIAPKAIKKLKAVAIRKTIANKKNVGYQTSMQNWVMQRLAKALN